MLLGKFPLEVRPRHAEYNYWKHLVLFQYEYELCGARDIVCLDSGAVSCQWRCFCAMLLCTGWSNLSQSRF